MLRTWPMTYSTGKWLIAGGFLAAAVWWMVASQPVPSPAKSRVPVRQKHSVKAPTVKKAKTPARRLPSPVAKKSVKKAKKGPVCSSWTKNLPAHDRPSNFPYRLQGTSVAEVSASSLATFHDIGRKHTGIYKEGDTLGTGVLCRIERKRVWIAQKGSFFVATIEPTSLPAIPPARRNTKRPRRVLKIDTYRSLHAFRRQLRTEVRSLRRLRTPPSTPKKREVSP